MEDISSKILKEVIDVFNYCYKTNSSIMAFARKMSKGNITYKDCNRYARQICKCFEKSIRTVLIEENLPNGKLYLDMAKIILIPILENNHNLVNTAFNEVSKKINLKYGIRISSVKTKVDIEKINGIINNACEEGVDLSTSINRVCNNGSNFTMKSLDNLAKENARYMVELGFGAQVIRTSESNCCDWCERLAGIYNYSDVKGTGNDVWKRHSGCNCEISYIMTSNPKKY